MIDIYNALIQRLTTSSITDIDLSDIAFDNADFDPKNKDAWLSTNFIPVERGGSNKTAMSAEDTGLFQVDVFVPLNDATGGTKRYNLRALEIVTDILSAFPEHDTITYNDTKVEIEESTFAAPLISESWYQIPLTINYRRL
jgi:hypothetical protein